MIGSSEMYSMATSTSTDLHTLISMVLVSTSALRGTIF